MNIYIEKYDPYEGVLLADFTEIKHFNEFCSRIDFPISGSRTMLYVEGLRFNSGVIPKEGSVYSFPEELITELSWIREPDSDNEGLQRQGSDIIAFRAKSKTIVHSYFSKSLNKQTWTKAELTWSGEPCGANEINGNIKVLIKNVGQGNWNEIYANDKCILIYDLGSSIHYSTSEVKEIIRNSNAFTFKPTLIISHWDVDHYKAIFQIESHLLSRLCCVFCPSNIPNLTSKRAYEILKQNCNYINAIDSSNTRLIKRKVSLSPLYSGSNYKLFRGEMSSNRNKSGLSITLWSDINSVILAGDHYYSQIFDNIYSEIPSGMRLNIVTPHHGGEAGRIDKYIGVITNVNKAVTSTGTNNYGHPKDTNRKDLARMGFSWSRTDHINNDITIQL
ncbi:hypothetical protein [Paenibacillus pabuli]|uniref:hypothetical protein n=1 Tax=Paenibacillus pabuli TaxID=1472 RepID=UPI003CF2BB3E